MQVHNKYTGEDFDEDLRSVLRRSGCKDEKIAFILDESNVLDSGFLERMNTLLANGEVPGLFEGVYEIASFSYTLYRVRHKSVNTPVRHKSVNTPSSQYIIIYHQYIVSYSFTPNHYIL